MVSVAYLPFATGDERVICGLTGEMPNALLFSCTARPDSGVLLLFPVIRWVLQADWFQGSESGVTKA